MNINNLSNNISNNISYISNNNMNDISQSNELLNKKSKHFSKKYEKEDDKIIIKDGEIQSIPNITNEPNKKKNLNQINEVLNVENVSPFKVNNKKRKNSNLKIEFSFKKKFLNED